MKKSLLALAVLGAFAGAAQAQSSVTVYGSIDGGLRHVSNTTAANGAINSRDSRLTMGSTGNFNQNRIGFKGVEDLGGGMHARFTLETGFNSGTGALDNTDSVLFRRTASVGLGGSWGGVDFGRQYSVNFKTIGAYDPFAYKYTGIIPLATQGGLTRLDNDIQYTGTFGGLTVRAEYAVGEQPGDTGDNSTQAIGATYAAGPLSVGGAFTQAKRTAAAPFGDGEFRDFDNWTFGGAYVAGPFRVAAGYARATQDLTATTENKTTNTWIGGSYNLSAAAQLSLAYYRTKADNPGAAGDARRNLLILGGTYALSKRTNLYANIDSAKYDGALRFTDANGTEDRVTGISVGVNHLF